MFVLISCFYVHFFIGNKFVDDFHNIEKTDQILYGDVLLDHIIEPEYHSLGFFSFLQAQGG
jgi:hypothetical protein